MKEKKDKICKNSGITLVALVITIILLLILAGISISALTGSGLFKKAEEAAKSSDRANVKEQLQLAVMTSRINLNGNIDKEELRKELDNLKKDGTIDSYEEVTGDSTIIFTTTKGKNEYEIDEDGNVELKGAIIVVSGLTVRNGDTVLTESSEKVAIGQALKVSFNAEIEGGTIISVKVKETEITNNNGEIEYTTDGSISIIFEIEGKNEEGKTVTKEYKVNLKEYYDIPKMKVGDYVNYTSDTPTTEQITVLNNEINTYSGYNEEEQTLSQTAGMKWRVLELDETGTKPKTLISASTTNESLTLKGADGYNNAVYLINEACRILYSKEGVGEARSIAIEDFEKHYTEVAKNERDAFTTNEGVKYGETKRYEGNYTNYPNIALEENNVGIDTLPLDTNNKNPLKTDGLNRSEQGKNADGSYKIYTGSGQAITNGMTAMQSFYWLGKQNFDLSSAYENSVYYNLFHSSVGSTYWLASRSIYAEISHCIFDVWRALNTMLIPVNGLFSTYGNSSTGLGTLRPLVNLETNIQAEYEGVVDSIYNIWNIM